MRHLFIALSLLFGLLGQAQSLVSMELLGTTPAADLNVVPGLVVDFDVEYYKVVYMTTNTQGDSIMASGGFAKPVGLPCSQFPMAIYMHGTVLNKEDVPSRDNLEASIPKLIGGLGYYGLAPDYIGMGDGPGLHPYLHAETQATAGVDMVKAVLEYLEDIEEPSNGELLITGYSQGGHAAMAMHKYIQDNDALAEMDVIGSAPASGPYDLSGSQTPVLLSDEPYSNPGYVVYILSSYEVAYGNIYDSYSDILQSPYDGIVVPYFSGDNTSLTMAQLNPQLTQVLSDLMNPTWLDEFENNLAHPMRVALANNDVYDWAPVAPVRMFYCTADEQVDFSNSVNTELVMQANGASDVQALPLGPLDHGNCFLPAMLGALNFFSTIRTACLPVGVPEYDLQARLMENPVAEELRIDIVEYWDEVELLDGSGRRIALERDVNPGLQTRDVSSFSPGIYFLRFTNAQGDSAVMRWMKE